MCVEVKDIYVTCVEVKDIHVRLLMLRIFI